MNTCDSDDEWQKAYKGGKHFRRWAGYHYHRFDWEMWEKFENTIDETLIWATQEGNRGVGMPEIDEELGINWDVADRGGVLEKYDPDPTEPEATENEESEESEEESGEEEEEDDEDEIEEEPVATENLRKRYPNSPMIHIVPS